jgi:hypothetical protein
MNPQPSLLISFCHSHHFWHSNHQNCAAVVCDPAIPTRLTPEGLSCRRCTRPSHHQHPNTAVTEPYATACTPSQRQTVQQHARHRHRLRWRPLPLVRSQG